MQDSKQHKWVKDEIINTLFSELKRIYGRVGKPDKKVMKELVVKLGHVYPSMFVECQGKSLNKLLKRLIY